MEFIQNSDFECLENLIFGVHACCFLLLKETYNGKQCVNDFDILCKQSPEHLDCLLNLIFKNSDPSEIINDGRLQF